MKLTKKEIIQNLLVILGLAILYFIIWFKKQIEI